MAKVRVSELAKEYGVKSAEVITMLTDLGEYVKARRPVSNRPL